jgi:hypothetical protein
LISLSVPSLSMDASNSSGPLSHRFSLLVL